MKTPNSTVLEIEITAKLLQTGQFGIDSPQKLKSIRDHFFKEVRDYLTMCGKEIPHYLLIYCKKCGTYENVYSEGTTCTDCAKKEQDKPRHGSLERYVYTTTTQGEIGKFLGKIAGKELTDLACQLTILAKANGHTHYLFDNTDLGTYMDDDDNPLMIFKQKQAKKK
jgi:hypothetical protein